MNPIDLKINIHETASFDIAATIEDANNGIGQGDERWRMLWHEPMRSEHLRSIRTLVDTHKPSCKNVLVLGIGGSALGTKALHSALGSASPALFVLDNIDAHTVRHTIQKIRDNDPDFSHTVVTVISKSGETAEIAGLLLIVERTMQGASFVAITGSTGSLFEYASIRQWSILPVPDGVGGRFSVLSPVGLFPAAMCGIDIELLLDGALAMDTRCKLIEDNPAADLACALVASLQAGRSTHIMMPYCDRLIQFAQWYVQLWAESLGKINSSGQRVGPTPIAAVGATDQHSMLQLWREGPPDKVIGFVQVNETDDMQIGDTPMSESQRWLCGHSLNSLMRTQMEATRASMQDANQGTWTLTLDRLDAHSIGQFIALWQATVAIAGRLLKVNPYDQPGVEYGKLRTRASTNKLSRG